jgi:hypothetical protein
MNPHSSLYFDFSCSHLSKTNSDYNAVANDANGSPGRFSSIADKNQNENSDRSQQSSYSSDFTYSHLINSSSEKTSEHLRKNEDEGVLLDPETIAKAFRGTSEMEGTSDPSDISITSGLIHVAARSIKASENSDPSTQASVNSQTFHRFTHGGLGDRPMLSGKNGQIERGKNMAQLARALDVIVDSTDEEDGGASLDSSIRSECDVEAPSGQKSKTDSNSSDTLVPHKAEYESAAKIATRYGFASLSKHASACSPIQEDDDARKISRTPQAKITVAKVSTRFGVASCSERASADPVPESKRSLTSTTKVLKSRAKVSESTKSKEGSLTELSFRPSSGLQNQTVPDHAIAQIVNLIDKFKEEQIRNIAISSPAQSPRKLGFQARRSSPRSFATSIQSELVAFQETNNFDSCPSIDDDVWGNQTSRHQRSDDDYFSATSKLDKYSSTDEYEEIDKYYSIDCGNDDNELLAAKGGAGSYLVPFRASRSSSEASIVSTVQSKFFPGVGSPVSNGHSLSRRSTLTSGTSMTMQSITRSIGLGDGAFHSFNDNVPSMLTSHSSTDVSGASSSSMDVTLSAPTNSTFDSKPSTIMAPAPHRTSGSFGPSSEGFNRQILRKTGGNGVYPKKIQSRNSSTEHLKSKEKDLNVVKARGVTSIVSKAYYKESDDSAHRYALEPQSGTRWLLQCAGGGGLSYCLGGDDSTSVSGRATVLTGTFSDKKGPSSIESKPTADLFWNPGSAFCKCGISPCFDEGHSHHLHRAIQAELSKQHK